MEVGLNKFIANWIINNIKREEKLTKIKLKDSKLNKEDFNILLYLIYNKYVTNNKGKEILHTLYTTENTLGNMLLNED